MRHVHHFKPIIAHGFQRRDALTDTVHENLAAAVTLYREMDMDFFHPTWSGQPWVVLDAIALVLRGG